MAITACLLLQPSRAAIVKVEFDGNNPAGSVEFVAEFKPQGADDSAYTLLAIDQGELIPDTTPQRFRLTIPNVAPGRYTFRVAARRVGDPTLQSGFSDTADHAVVPGVPANLLITLRILPAGGIVVELPNGRLLLRG